MEAMRLMNETGFLSRFIPDWARIVGLMQFDTYHVYTVDEPVDFKKVMDAGVDGIFTNRASELLKYFKRPETGSVTQLLQNNGY